MAENISVEIYTKFLNKAKLTGVDRETLKANRGFSDKIIDEFKFVSGGKQNRKIINDLRNEYDDQVLLKVGILEEVNENLRPCSMLLDKRIIIPYLDESGEKVTLLRPHKLGLKNVKIQVYSRYLLKDKPGHIILTEGEFKAVALAQWGIPGIAVPGIGSFGGKHFSRLVDLLKEFKIKKITIIYDNEAKDDPAYDTYKEKPEERWDTPYWSYIMAQKLSKEKFTVRIGQLPAEWMKNGKIDFDGALAQGKTKSDIINIRNNAYSKTEFLNTLKDEAQRIVRRKIAIYFSSSPVWRNFNKYMIKRRKGDAEWDEQISNFVINIKASFFTPDGCMRHVEFVNEFGEKSRTFILEPSDMAGVGKFKEYCFSRGNYVWEGNGSDLQEVWKFELMRDTGDMIYMPETIGEIEPKFWLFSNIAIKNNEIYYPDSDGIFWIDGRGYKPQSINVGPRGEAMEDAIPALYLDEKIDIKEVAVILKKSIGGYQAYIGLGWVIATIFSRTIFNEFKSFPFLFPHGKREAGKSTFMRWLMAFFGVETEGTSIAESSQNYIMRALSYYSSMGVWFDEYRNERQITQKDGYLRSAYNRQLSGKGVKSAFGTRAYNVKATLAISGEELPKDSGLYTRCIPLQMSANRREREHYDWLNRVSEKFSAFTFHLLKNYERYEKKIIKNIKELKAKLVEMDITDRTAENWAIMAGSFDAVVMEDQDFIKWVLKACKEVRRVAEEEHLLNVFWNDVIILESQGAIGQNHIAVNNVNGKDCLAIWFPAIYNIWADNYRRRTGKEPFDRASISQYIKDESYYIDYKSVRLNDAVRKCYIIDPELGPEIIQEFKDTIIYNKQYNGQMYK